ncbi:MAG: NifU N-terminal domain-containing protein, partial [Acetobacteraceae bacterium]|nr:NifU N-terminal domain-containing protein [Acetobacteraceae bacterium]
TRVFLGSDFITVTKSDDKDWGSMKTWILGTIMKRIKGLCGAKPPQKPRWTNVGRYGDFINDVRRLGQSLRLGQDSWQRTTGYRGRKWRAWGDRPRRLEQGWDRRLRW